MFLLGILTGFLLSMIIIPLILYLSRFKIASFLARKSLEKMEDKLIKLFGDDSEE